MRERERMRERDRMSMREIDRMREGDTIRERKSKKTTFERDAENRLGGLREAARKNEEP